jgi:hypothetical protein
MYSFGNFSAFFTKLKKKHLLKISAVYLIGKAEICQDSLTWGQDDQTLSLIKIACFMLNFLNLKSKSSHLFVWVASK